MSRSTPSDRRRLPALASLVLGVTLVATACGQNGSSASPAASVPAATPSSVPTVSSSAVPSAAAPSSSAAAGVDAIYDTVEQQVVAIRGLKPSKTVERDFITPAEAKTMLAKDFDTETPAAYLAGTERLYKALGLIPADSSLRDLTIDLLGGAVAAFYRDDEGKLYVITKTGEPGPAERFYFAHEYDHALQDQNSTIFKDQHAVYDQGDRLLARQAIYEGDASLLMAQWAAANLSQQDLLAVLTAGNDPEGQAVLARTPAILRDTLTFPYSTGLGYVQTAQANGGWPAVDAFFKAMPESTEQILHPEKYTSHESPVKVTLPADLATRLGTGWTVPIQDTFGEYQLGVWLRESGVTSAAANDAATGWGGDRLAVVEGPDGAWAVAMQTAWDTVADAAAFEKAAKTALKKSAGVGQVLPGAGGKTRWLLIANDNATAGKVAGVLGLAG
jgi:hypothetical protein